MNFPAPDSAAPAPVPPSAPAPAMSDHDSVTPHHGAPNRVTPNQWHALRGVWRLTARRWLAPRRLLAAAGLLAALGGIAYATNPAGDGRAFFEWWGEFFIGAALPILAFLSGAGAIRDDLKTGSADYLFTRPIRRPVFVVARYLAHLACVQLAYLAAFAVLVGVAVLRDIPGLAAALPFLLLAQVLTLTGFVALGFLGGVAVARYLVGGLLYGGLVEAAAGLIPTQLSRVSMTRQVGEFLQPLLGVESEAASVVAGVPVSGGADGALGTSLHLLAFAALFVAAAAGLFSFKEFVGDAARE